MRGSSSANPESGDATSKQFMHDMIPLLPIAPQNSARAGASPMTPETIQTNTSCGPAKEKASCGPAIEKNSVRPAKSKANGGQAKSKASCGPAK